MFERLKTFITQGESRPSDGSARAPTPLSPPDAPGPFIARPRTPPPKSPLVQVRSSASRDQQLIGLTMENLLHAARRLSVADLTAAAIDLKRVAYQAGKAPSDLLNAADPSGRQIFDHLAATAIDVKEKLGVLLSLGCRIDKTNRRGDNAMHAAARSGNGPLVEALALRSTTLSSMPTARAEPYSSATPLAIAIICGHADIARRLLRQHAGLGGVCCEDADRAVLTPQELYARLDNRSADMSRALRTGPASSAMAHPARGSHPGLPRVSEPRIDA